jgi:hypothetical protein
MCQLRFAARYYFSLLYKSLTPPFSMHLSCTDHSALCIVGSGEASYGRLVGVAVLTRHSGQCVMALAGNVCAAWLSREMHVESVPMCAPMALHTAHDTAYCVCVTRQDTRCFLLVLPFNLHHPAHSCRLSMCGMTRRAPLCTAHLQFVVVGFPRGDRGESWAIQHSTTSLALPASRAPPAFASSLY